MDASLGFFWFFTPEDCVSTVQFMNAEHAQLAIEKYNGGILEVSDLPVQVAPWVLSPLWLHEFIWIPHWYSGSDKRKPEDEQISLQVPWLWFTALKLRYTVKLEGPHPFCSGFSCGKQMRYHALPSPKWLFPNPELPPCNCKIRWSGSEIRRWKFDETIAGGW